METIYSLKIFNYQPPIAHRADWAADFRWVVVGFEMFQVLPPNCN